LTGKTIQAIGIANSSSLIHRVLVICPSSLKLNWKKEWLKWDVKSLSVGIVSAGKKQFPEADVVILNYDMLGKFQNSLRSVEWDLLIIDECHYLKEGKTGRTQEVFGRKKARVQKRTRTVEIELADGTKKKVKEQYDREVLALEPLKARRRVFLTGTPIVNRPKELWALVQSLDPDGLGSNWKRYAERYCAGHQTRFGYDWSGSSNLPELQEKLRSRFMIRRLKMDVLKELPAKRRQIISLETEGTAILKIIEKEKKTYAEYEEALKGGEFSFETPAFQEISKVRKETAIAKIPYVVDHLKGILEDGTDKIVVMAHHHEVVDNLVSALREFGVVSVDGRTSNENRQKAVDAFQENSDIRVFVGTIKAAGVGLTLTASSTVIFAELDWVPGNVTQAEDRVHRIGQRNAVMIYHLVLEGSLDERMVEIIIEKQKTIDSALDIEAQNEALPLPEISDTTEKQRYEASRPKPKAPKSTGLIWREASKEREVRTNLEEIVNPYSQEQTEAIHAGLKLIAGACDGAQNIDDRGFNKTDTNFGKSLAHAMSLTPRQAIAGFKLVRKYHRQISPDILQTLNI
jgi:SWI/SNF-related matrix-associated actin-dependent regulator 1 of chromatin subfamily A